MRCTFRKNFWPNLVMLICQRQGCKNMIGASKGSDKTGCRMVPSLAGNVNSFYMLSASVNIPKLQAPPIQVSASGTKKDTCVSIGLFQGNPGSAQMMPIPFNSHKMNSKWFISVEEKKPFARLWSKFLPQQNYSARLLRFLLRVCPLFSSQLRSAVFGARVIFASDHSFVFETKGNRTICSVCLQAMILVRICQKWSTFGSGV